jgi:predicted ATPase
MGDRIIKTGIRKHLEVFTSCLNDLSKGKGSIIAISGEEGYGKTHLLNTFAEEAKKNNSYVNIIFEKNVSPIGSFNIGNIQPLLPFMRVMEKIILGDTYDQASAKSKLMKNAGLTILASVPLIDTIFYATKELGKDWRQYKKDKSSEKRNKNASNTSKDFYDSLSSFAEKKPLVILIDDFHWSDAQSIELLSLFAEDIHSVPIILVVAYRESIVNSLASPLISFISSKLDNAEGVLGIKLKELNKEDISLLIPFYIDNYKTNFTFEGWIYDNSFGVAGIVTEYLKYFADSSPFQNDGTLITNFENSNYLPSTIHSAFSKTIEKLNDDERNLLSICSAEGRECTALVVSNLLNNDILTTIKKLRSIQQKFGIIRSIGAFTRYGVKTTIYEFAQAFYKKYFESLLEYEEKVALHGQIAALLKDRYQSAESEALRQEIAPYLAAHSFESGDQDTAKSMLLVSAQAAQRYGNKEIIQNVYDRFKELGIDETDSNNNPDLMAFKEILNNVNIINGVSASDNSNGSGAYGSGQDAVSNYYDFSASRKIIVEYYHQNRFNEAIEYALSFINKSENDLRSTEKAQLYALIIKSYIELNEMSLAENYAMQALDLIESFNDPIAHCFVMNSLAILRFYQNRKEEMMACLRSAAQKAIVLSPELRLLTLSNIALLSDESDSSKSKRYYESVRKLASALNFENFADQVLV